MFGLFGKKEKIEYSVTTTAGETFLAGPKDTVLNAGLEADLDLPYNCRAGGCGACKCTLKEGEVQHRTDPAYVLSEEELASGMILACQAVPKSDLLVSWDSEGDAGDGVESESTATFTGTVTKVDMRTHDIVELSVDLDQMPEYQSGQSVLLKLMAENVPARSYSFASAPNGSNSVQFHIRHVPGGKFTDALFERIEQDALLGQKIELSNVAGSFLYAGRVDTVVMIAGGSGLAPIRALLQKIAQEPPTDRPNTIEVFFGGRQQRDLYADAYIESEFMGLGLNLRWHNVLSDEPSGSNWDGARGYVGDYAASLMRDTQAHIQHLYMCGPPAMIDHAESRFKELGLHGSQIFADRFLDARHS